MSVKDQPKAVWAVAFACVIAFMGIGLVDPILPVLAQSLDATPSQVSLLFTSYFAVTGVSMLVTGYVSSRIGPRKTLLAGLVLVILFSALAGLSGSIPEIVGFRAGWGLGNALFIATALSVIIGSASGGISGAIILYEAALGLGIASGPLLGGFLGGISWRGPFFGTAALMAIAFVAIMVLLEELPRPQRKVGITEPLRALSHRGLLITGLVALFYNFGFFTLLAYTPFPLEMGAHALGLVFFGWGLLLAISSVFAAPTLKRRFGVVKTLGAMYAALALILAIMGFGTGSPALLAVAVIAAGAVLGVVNTVLTEAVMRVAPVERPIASSAYSFVRFAGGAVAPWLAGKLAEWVAPDTPFFVGAAAVLVALGVLVAGRAYFAEEEEIEVATVTPIAPVLESREMAGAVLALRLAQLREAGVVAGGEVVHTYGDREDAVRAILSRIEEVGAQAVVVGRRGQVAARANVPVVVVPA